MIISRVCRKSLVSQKRVDQNRHSVAAIMALPMAGLGEGVPCQSLIKHYLDDTPEGA
jgi:hypothetical protein